MEQNGWNMPNTRKRKRRRGPQKPPLTGQLLLDNRLKGDGKTGILSHDLYDELFPGSGANQTSQDRRYVAVTPSGKLSMRSDAASWTIAPVKRASQSTFKQSTVLFPNTSTALQSFSRAWEKSSSASDRHSSSSGIDTFVLDVIPVPLDTVYVAVEKGQEKRSKSNRQQSGSLASRASLQGLQKDELPLFNNGFVDPKVEATVRRALENESILRSGDELQANFQGSKSSLSMTIQHCEPVAQGSLKPNTNIVIVPGHGRIKTPNSQVQLPVATSITEDEGEETSNEQYHTAVEDASGDLRSSHSKSSETETSDDDMSDPESGAEVIGLSLPMLPSSSAPGGMTFSSATPRAGGLLSNGIGSPGSVISGMSMSTVLGGGTRGKLFQACGLMQPVPNDALHPHPSNEEDDEARIFVDTTSLKRLGCFSGDWVRIEAAPDKDFSTLGSWGIGAFEDQDEGTESRCLRIYALPGESGSRPRYAIDKSGHGPAGAGLFNSAQRKALLKAFVSPIMLANLGSPPNIRVAPMAPSQGRKFSKAGPNLSGERITTLSTPPVASEVTLRKYSTPIAYEKALDSSIKWAVGDYFTKRHRAVKPGDLIAIPLSASLAKAVDQGGSQDEDAAQRELATSAAGEGTKTKNQVVWFKVGAVHSDDSTPDSPWEGMCVVKTDVTKVSQISNDERGKLPDSMSNPWVYYLGVKSLPSTVDESHLFTAQSSLTHHISPVRRQLRQHLSVATNPQSIHLKLPPTAILLASTQRQVGKASLAINASTDLGLHVFTIDAYDILSEGGAGGGDVKTAGYLEARATRGLLSGAEHTVILLKHIEVFTAERMTESLSEILQKCRILIATTTAVDKISEGMRSLFTHEIDIAAPDEGEREGLLHDIVQENGIALSPDVDLSAIAVKTAALVAGDLVDVVDRACVERRNRLEMLAKSSTLQTSHGLIQANIRDVELAGGYASRCVLRSDFDAAVDAARKNFADAIGAPKIPSVSWDDVGGLSNVKDAVMETIQLPLERPELFAKGMKKRSGILFYGPPGTGKTLLAKAIATEFSLNFFSVKGPELLNMYIGESEANVRRVFQRARDARPCVVFFDELDSVAPKRGNQGDSGGVMDRIVSQLLAELDGMSNGDGAGTGGVFVIGATNRPDLLDQALLRPGRFDKMLYLGISDTHQKQLTILQALTRKFTLSPSLSLETVSEKLPFTYTGADLYALCSDAMLKAITRKSTAVDVAIKKLNASRAQQTPPQPPISIAYFFDHFATNSDTAVMVEQEDFDAAQKELVPSVSLGELEHYERVRRTFESTDSATDKMKNGTKVNGKQGSLDGIANVVKNTLLQQSSASGEGDLVDGVADMSISDAPVRNKGKGKAVQVEQNNRLEFEKEEDTDLYD